MIIQIIIIISEEFELNAFKINFSDHNKRVTSPLA